MPFAFHNSDQMANHMLEIFFKKCCKILCISNVTKLFMFNAFSNRNCQLGFNNFQESKFEWVNLKISNHNDLNMSSYNK